MDPRELAKRCLVEDHMNLKETAAVTGLTERVIKEHMYRFSLTHSLKIY